MLKAREVDLFADKEWVGEFFPPGQSDSRFSGRLKYSPSEGVRLNYAVVGDEVPMIDGVIHGVLVSGEPVTLYRNTPGLPANFGYTHGVTTQRGEASFWALCVGAHLDADASCLRYTFTVSGLDEFIVPEGMTSHVPWSHKPIVIVSMADGDLHLSNAGSVDYVGDISASILNLNPGAAEALKVAYSEVAASYPANPFFVKKSMHYELDLHYGSEVCVRDALRRIIEIGDLFALLVRAPVHPRRVGFKADVGIGTDVEVFVYPSLYIDAGTIDRATDKKSYHTMPIKLANIDLAKLIPAWLPVAGAYRGLVSDLQTRTGWLTGQAIRGSIVLYATQFEAIHASDKAPKGKKYEYVLDHYASPQLIAKLHLHLKGTTNSHLATAISGLRNEIAHLGKPSKLVANLGRGLTVVALCLELVVIGYILRKLGVDPKVAAVYQDTFTPD